MCRKILVKLSNIKFHEICSAILELLHAHRQTNEVILLATPQGYKHIKFGVMNTKPTKVLFHKQ